MNRRNSALVIVDVQNAAMAARPYQGELMLDRINRLLRKARQSGTPVIFVQHEDDEEF